MRNISCLLAVLVLSAAAYGQPYDQQTIDTKISRLRWMVGPATHRLPERNATIRISHNQAYLESKDAREYLRLTEGHDRFKPDAIVVNTGGIVEGSMVWYEHVKAGYVRMNDWKENIDPDEILRSIQANTAEANRVRQPGYPKLTVDGWAEKPQLYRGMAYVIWAIKGHDDRGNRFVNARALKLGKKGYAVMVWVGSPDQFYSAAANLQAAYDGYRFERGYRYADYKPGTDKVAALGVGAIAYRMLTGTNKKGATVAGAGFLAFLAVAAKKFWFLVLLPFVFAWNWIKRLFTGR